jgi:hypothetical protein
VPLAEVLLRRESCLRKRSLGVVCRALAGWYGLRNRLSRRPVADPAGSADVMLTSFGTRLDRVHLVIESIAAGAARPRSLTLVVNRPEFRPGPGLARLVARGLRLVPSEDLGPHKKYRPHLARATFERPLVTADDDVFYPRRWLRDLLDVAGSHPGHVVAHRTHVIMLRDGAIAPYLDWRTNTSTAAHPRHFATGIGGVLYPPAMLAALRRSPFPEHCRHADDIWLHAVALRSGVSVRQVRPRPAEFRPVPGIAGSDLFDRNVIGGGNDAVIAAVYTVDDVAALSVTENPRTRPAPR